MWIEGERDEEHIACVEIADDGVADSHGACCLVGFVVTSDLLFFVFL